VPPFVEKGWRNSLYQKLETDRREHGQPAACVIAQQYTSATVAVYIHCRKKNLEARFKNYCFFNVFTFFKNAYLKTHDLKMNKSKDVSVRIYLSCLFIPKHHILKADSLSILKQEEAI
jgi:hypothetical protein